MKRLVRYALAALLSAVLFPGCYGGQGGSGGACTGDGDDCHAGSGGPGGPAVQVVSVQFGSRCCNDAEVPVCYANGPMGGGCGCMTPFGVGYGHVC
ncbi:MAG: hypothetical protein R3B07_11710 [Polyangiaceae bacterium]